MAEGGRGNKIKRLQIICANIKQMIDEDKKGESDSEMDRELPKSDTEENNEKENADVTADGYVY